MSDIGQNDQGEQAVDRKELLAAQFDEVEQQAGQASDDRPRDAQGKFAPKQADAPQPKAAGTATAQDAPAQQDAPAWTKAPESWKKDIREKWGTLDPTYQQYIHEREQQMRAGVEPLLPKAQLADAINKVAEPYINTIRGLGIDLPQAVQGLMKADHDLRTLPHDQKVQLLQNIAAGYGIDLSGQLQNAQPAFSPYLQQMQNELVGIKGQFSNFMQQQEAVQQSSALSEIQKFSATAEHFEDAKPTMIQLLQSGMADSLADAYDKAIRLNPELFDAVQSAKQAAVEQAKRSTANAAAQKAKAAAVSVRSATPGTAKATNAQDRRSMLAEQFSGLSERL